jgi:putative peptide zinc metalloprotease protein
VSRAPAKDREALDLQARSARTQADLYEQEKKLLDARLAGLAQLVAPRAGVVMSLPHPDEVGKLFDKYSSQGRPVCLVGDPTRLVVKVPVVPLDYRLLREDLPPGGALDVTVCVSGRTHRLYNGKLRKLPESDAKQVPLALTQRGGGPLAVKQSGDGGQETQPLAQVYLIEVELTDPDVTVRPGALVQVKVHCQWRSAAWWVGRKLSEALDIGLY